MAHKENVSIATCNQVAVRGHWKQYITLMFIILVAIISILIGQWLYSNNVSQKKSLFDNQNDVSKVNEKHFIPKYLMNSKIKEIKVIKEAKSEIESIKQINLENDNIVTYSTSYKDQNDNIETKIQKKFIKQNIDDSKAKKQNQLLNSNLNSREYFPELNKLKKLAHLNENKIDKTNSNNNEMTLEQVEKMSIHKTIKNEKKIDTKINNVMEESLLNSKVDDSRVESIENELQLEKVQNDTIKALKELIFRKEFLSNFVKDYISYMLSQIELYKSNNTPLKSFVDTLKLNATINDFFKESDFDKLDEILNRLKEKRIQILDSSNIIYENTIESQNKHPLNEIDEVDEFERDFEYLNMKISMFDNHDLSLHKWIKWKEIFNSRNNNNELIDSNENIEQKENEEIVLIHIDSHPDLSLPKFFEEKKFTLNYDRKWILKNVKIADFIVPAAYLGLIDKMIWIAPLSSNQIPVGLHTISIGTYKDKKGRINLGVDSNLNYYKTFKLPPGEILHNIKQLSLEVINLESLNSETLPVFLKTIDNSKIKYLLDIDLDYFSTIHPILTSLIEKDNEKNRETLSRILDPKTYCSQDEKIYPLNKMRRQVILTWGNVIEFCVKHNTLKDSSMAYFMKIVKPLIQGYWCNGTKDATNFLLDIYDGIESMESLIPEHCYSIAYSNLPLYIANDQDISSSIQRITSFLRILLQKFGKPKIITIARSVFDHYTPFTMWENIETIVYKIIHDVYNNKLNDK